MAMKKIFKLDGLGGKGRHIASLAVQARYIMKNNPMNLCDESMPLFFPEGLVMEARRAHEGSREERRRFDKMTIFVTRASLWLGRVRDGLSYYDFEERVTIGQRVGHFLNTIRGR
jgi:ligand-binding sensor domain-containing protein